MADDRAGEERMQAVKAYPGCTCGKVACITQRQIINAHRYIAQWRPQIRQEAPMTIKAGDTLPSAQFMTMTADGPRPISSDEIFKGKTVALFAVPGAYTPTCSAKHLPGFKDHEADLKAKGVDTIACVSVNDVFVMGHWGKDQDVGEKVLMLADGNGDFTKAIGLELDGSKFGMGARSQRYSMIVKDGVVEKLNVEEGGDFKVSSADYMLAQF
jgi:peroxiredoxin